MTTIATDGRSMAGDGRVTEGDVITQDDYRKIRKLGDGRIVAFSGNAYNDDSVVAWLENQDRGEPPKGLEDESFGCLVLSPDGTLTTYDQYGREFHESPPYAMGSGRRFALAALDLGKSPREAVAYACTRDVFSGGEITVLTIEPPIRAVA